MTMRMLEARRSDMPIITPRPATVDNPQQRTDQRIPRAKIQPGALKGNTNHGWMRDRYEDTGDDCDGGVKEEAMGKPVAKKQECPNS